MEGREEWSGRTTRVLQAAMLVAINGGKT